MRPDVKLGVAISLVIILVAGGYYLYRDSREQPVPLSGDRTAAARPGARDELQRKGATKISTAGKRASGTSAGSTAAAKGNRDQRKRHVAGGQVPSTATGELGQKGSTRLDPRSTRVATTKPTDGTTKRVAGSKPGRGSAVSQPSPTRYAGGGANSRRGGSPASAGRAQDARKTVDKATKRSDVGAIRQSSGSAGARAANAARGAPDLPERVDNIPPTNGHVTRVSPVRAGSKRQEVAVDTHRVQAGDTFASLALAYYGNEKYTRFLIESNPQVKDPRRIQIGAVLKVPPLMGGRADAAKNRTTGRSSRDVRTADHRTYRVEPGDSFYAIARTVLGDAGRWGELYALNRSRVGGDPSKLQVGQVLILPK